MKITVKTLSGKQLPLEIEDKWTIKQVKDEIEKQHDLKSDALKLIAYGKVLDKDENSVESYSIKENDFIVAMVQKAKAAPKQKPNPEPEPKKEDAKKEEPEPKNNADPQPQPASVANPPQQPQPSAQAQPAQNTLPPEVEAAINELMAISGKPRDMCLQALQAAQNIPDVAFEFLMSGHIPQVPQNSGGGGPEVPEEYGDEDMGGDASGALGQYNLQPETLEAIQALVNNPSFPMIRQRMIQDPNFSAQFMQQLQQTQPQIFNAIQQNPGILMSLILGHDPMAGMGAGGGAGHGAGHPQPPPGSIQVSQEEMEAIERLVSLGFTKTRAAEAYFACDKNEEMAANFLFEAGAEDEETATQNAIAASQQAANPNPPAQQDQQNQNNNPPADDKDKPEGGDGAGAGGDAAGGDGNGSSLV